MNRIEHPLKRIFELTKDQWDQPTVRPAVRDNLRKVLQCRTPELGGEIYASKAVQKVFYHTCKSKCCPSCGNRGTLLWQREQSATLPDTPFVGIVLTMPHVFWPIFKAHRHLQHDLPSLGTAALKQFAWNQYRVRVHGIVIQHTFGGRLNYVPHLHIMVSAGGLRPAKARWVNSLKFDWKEVMSLWRFAVCRYLWKAYRNRLLQKCAVPDEFCKVIDREEQRDWNIHITPQMSKEHFLRYAGRYIRRLPISQKNILDVTEEEVVYLSKDTRTKTLVEERCTPAEFVAIFMPHILDRYQHSMRYFGLQAPRSKKQLLEVASLLLGQHPQPKPRREPWAASLWRQFRVDPLIDESGYRMHWVGHRPPVPAP